MATFTTVDLRHAVHAARICNIECAKCLAHRSHHFPDFLKLLVLTSPFCLPRDPLSQLQILITVQSTPRLVNVSVAQRACHFLAYVVWYENKNGGKTVRLI